MSLLIQYLQLCWFKNNPIALRPLKPFIWKSIIFYLISGIIVEANISDPADATLEVAMRTIVALSLIALLVLITKKTELFYQLLTAIFICENFIVTLGIGTEILDVFVQRTPYEDYPMYLGAALIVWYLAIVSYILNRLFSFSIGSAISLAFIYFSLTYGGPFLVMEVV